MIHRFTKDSKAYRSRKGWSIPAILSSMLLTLVVASSFAQSKTIFDDDWTPPKSNKPAQPPTATPPQTPPDTGKPQAPATAPPPKVVAAPQLPRPIPPAADQAKSRKLFKDFYAKELADHSVAGRKALVSKLLAQASAVSDAPSDEFVLLVGATQAAKEASDLGLVISASDALEKAFEVDGLHVKSEAALQMLLRTESPTETAENCRIGMTLVDQLAAAEDYTTALKLLRSLQAAAPDAQLRTEIQRREKEIDALKTEADRIAIFTAKLKTSPDDPVANFNVGEHLCFVKGDWSHGLPLLAKGGEPKTRNLAAQEMKKPADAAGIVAVADGWWEFAETRHGSEKSEIQSHAQGYYRRVLPGLKGLTKLKAETRLTERTKPQTPSPNGQREFTNSLGMKFVRIEPGTFLMGSPPDELGHRKDETLHRVKITRPFMMSATLVTQAQWQAIMKHGAPRINGADLPVRYISWEDAVAFCQKISEKEGRHYRLPTEAEWEYACRAGSQTPYGGTNDLNAIGWFRGNSDGTTHPVAQKQPNAWGLYDMHGNLYQLCSDGYAPYDGDAVDPVGPEDVTRKVARGGSWYQVAFECRSASREKVEQGTRNDRFGFRVVLDPSGATASLKKPREGEANTVSPALIDEARAVIRAVPPEFDPESVAEWTDATRSAANQALLQQLGGKKAEFTFVMKWVSVKSRAVDSQPVIVGKVSFRLVLHFNAIDTKRFAGVRPGTTCTASGEILSPRFEGTELIVEMQHCKVVSTD